MQMPKQSVSSDPNLSKTHISPTRHAFRSKPKIVHGRNINRTSTGGSSSSLSSINLHHPYPYDMNINDQSSNSPYYKGLTDQSLAILDDLGSCRAPHTPIPCYPTTTFLSSGHSPYYKGLTDHSLVIGSNWSPVLHNHPHPPTNSLSYETSPYYRGLTDNSLALLGPHRSNSHSHSSILSINMKTREEELTAATGFIHSGQSCSSSPKIRTATDFTLKELMTKTDDIHGVGFLVEEKPLMETVSEEISNLGSALQEITQKSTVLEEMELMTNNVGLVIEEEEEKPLRERVSEEASNLNVESVLEEENAEKTILEEKVKEYYGLGGEKEKPLLLCVSEQTVASEELPRKDVTQDQDSIAEEGNGRYEYIWATKYQPMTLADFICNRDKALELKALVKEGCGCNHFIIEGPPSVGKRSMIRAMLREVFGADRVQVKEECKNFNLKGEMVDNLQVRIKKSLHHVEVNLSETKGYEKHVIVDLFKETYGKVINNSLPCSPENCQAIVLYESEKLSIESLLYIKWLLEKYKGCNKVFFCCSDETKLQLVKPLCTPFRLSPPSSQEILKILEYIGKKEGIKLSRDLVKKIILRSKNNLRQAIRSLEATCRNKDALKDDDLILTGWEDDILNIAKIIIEEQSPRQLYVIRRKLQSFMFHDVPPDFIYKSLIAELTTLVDDSLRSRVAKLDKEYNKASEIKFETMKQFGHAHNKQGDSDERNNEPTKKNALSYLKVEEFIAKFMSWYKNSSEKSNKHVQLIAAGT